ncbi:MAG TPA: DUF4412 domain-containing protein [Chitinophagaceae bacterium]|nr:DUF4412 domain-containing protein [Chitinophagaceae bacterium]
MKQLKLFILFILPSIFLFSCSGNTTKNESKDSPALSAPTTAGSGDDTYYELTTTSSGKNVAINGTTKMYVSSKGDMRTEMNMSNSASPNKNVLPMVLIGHSNKPNESISIDDEKKTYTINHIIPEDLNTGEKMQSTVTKVGEEKILGFNCVHAKIISKKTMGSFYSEIDTIDLWKSKEVPMQSNVKELFNQFESRTGNIMYSPEATAQLKQMSCDGFTVKMEMGSKDVSMVMQLTKVEHRDLPASMFEIPAGYNEVKE